jgi:hypothetical protein
VMRHGANLRAVRRSSVLILKLTDEDTAGFTSLLAASLAVVFETRRFDDREGITSRRFQSEVLPAQG